jgi:hypothetical protein
VGAEGGQVLDRLDEVGLALPVGADEDDDPSTERDVDPGVRPEVDELEMVDEHCLIVASSRTDA